MNLRDVNADVASLLLDLAAVHEGTPRHWGYRRAARALRELPQPIDELPERDRAAIPGIGPATLRILQEFLADESSSSVTAAVDESPRRDAVLAKRATRAVFLSAAMVEQVLQSRIPGAVEPEDYQGDFQMHSRDSDGADTLEEMAAACRARGYSKASITDHSVGLPVARGMSLETMRRQQRDIDAFNARSGGTFRLFKGIEANILADGSLDLPLDDRRGLELLLASPHLALRKTVDQTDRLLAAVSQPGVHILGHPRGRVYNTRVGIAADWPAVFRRASETGVAIEIDGDPSRQDVDFVLAQEAMAAGCVFALDSDAHSTDQLDYTRYALAHARLAGVPQERIVNCWSNEKLLEWSRSAWSSSR